MMKQREFEKRVIPKDSQFLISAGEYSDFQVFTVCRALEDLDVDALKEKYLSTFPKEREPYAFDYYRFLSWLLLFENLVLELDHIEWYLGSYGGSKMTIWINEKK